VDDTLFSVLVGFAPFVVFFLAMAFGLFGQPPAARPRRTWVWASALAGLVAVGVALWCVILHQEPARPLSPAAAVAPPAPPAVPPVARLAGVE
jgi:hypothetical protein